MGVTIKPQQKVQCNPIQSLLVPDFPLCLNCHKSIPSISFISKAFFVFIEVKCRNCNYFNTMNIENYFMQLTQLESLRHKCSLVKAHSSTEAQRHCIQCNQWLCKACVNNHKANDSTSKHLLLSQELSLKTKCLSHNGNALASYCNRCSIGICDLCKEDHSNHSVISFTQSKADIEQCLAKYQSFDDKRKQNDAIKASLIASIDKEIDNLNKLKLTILSAYERNEAVNKMLHSLFLSFKSSYELLPDIPHLELITNITTNLFIDNEPLSNSPNDLMLKSNCLNCINYWNSHYIIHFKNDLKGLSSIEVPNEKTLCGIQLNDLRLATGTNNKTIRIWSSDKLQCVDCVKGHEDKVFSLAQLSDERLLSGSVREIKCWKVLGWACIATIEEHSNTVFSLVKLRDNKFASASADKSIKLWDSLTLKCIHTFNEHECTVYCLAELNDGRIASGSRDKSIRIWSVTQQKSQGWLIGHTDNVNCLLHLKDGKLASGSSDNTLRLWDVDKRLLVKVLDGSRYVIFSVIQLNDGTLVTGSFKELIVRKIESNEMKNFTGHSGAIRGLIKLKDERIVSFSDDNTMKLWAF